MSVGLSLFEERGYEQTTVAQIAAAAGVAEMTFFRHFPTKHSLLVDDPYDPAISALVANQDRDLPSLQRVGRAFETALAGLTSAEDDEARRRIRIVASNPALRARTWEATQGTHAAIVEALTSTGVQEAEAHAAAGACLGALTATLLHWGGDPETALATQLRAALAVLTDADSRPETGP